MTSSPGFHAPDTPPTQNSFAPDNSDATGAIRKGQQSNSGERYKLLRYAYVFYNLFLLLMNPHTPQPRILIHEGEPCLDD
jgi:hypothetical protein